MRIVVSIKRCKHDSCKPEKKDKIENAFGRKRNCIREALKGRDMSSMLNERVWNSAETVLSPLFLCKIVRIEHFVEVLDLRVDLTLIPRLTSEHLKPTPIPQSGRS